MNIAIADALLIEATIFLGFGVIVGFVLFVKFVKKIRGHPGYKPAAGHFKRLRQMVA